MLAYHCLPRINPDPHLDALSRMLFFKTSQRRGISAVAFLVAVVSQVATANNSRIIISGCWMQIVVNPVL